MAIFALYGSMSTKQREAILVRLYLLHSHIPPLNGVALGAIRAHLTIVHINVAVFAILAHVGENRLYVALLAFHLFVHAAQRILRLTMIKLGNGANGPPGRSCMAVFARDRQRSVRTLSCLLLRQRCGDRAGGHPAEEQKPADNSCKRARKCLPYNNLRRYALILALADKGPAGQLADGIF